MKFPWEMASPQVVLTAADECFDDETFQQWKDEGFRVTYLPLIGTPKEFERGLHDFSDTLELGENYAIVGLLLLQHFLMANL
jgi:hypothetical protein